MLSAKMKINSSKPIHHCSNVNKSGDSSTTSSSSTSSSQSTTTTVSESKSNDHDQGNHFHGLLEQIGYIPIRSVADTLQGQIWIVHGKHSHRDCVMKVTSKKLHDCHESRSEINHNHNKAAHHILEDVVTEAKILKYLSSVQSVPSSIIGYRGFFASNKNYYLFMENGGEPLFDFIVRAHDLLEVNRLDIEEWIPIVRKISKQMIDALHFMHSLNVCHFDISLENMTLSKDIYINVKNMGRKNEKVVFSNKDEIEVKIIDFGLAHRFHAKEVDDEKHIFRTNRFCGKKNYQSPELLQRIPFNAAANDVWCAAVCLFMMVCGNGPWEIADESDMKYKLIMQGQIKPLLRHWGKLHYFDDSLLDLITSCFQPESKRISVAEMKKHPWLNVAEAVEKSQNVILDL